MTKIIFALSILFSTITFAYTPEHAVAVFKVNANVKSAIDQKVSEGFVFENPSAALISRGYGDEGFVDNYIVSVAGVKQVAPMERATVIVSAIVNIWSMSKSVTVVNSQDLENAVFSVIPQSR